MKNMIFPVKKMNDEARLLYKALCFEAGHERRTQHILKVYALSKMFGEIEKLPSEEQEILQAAAILHDIAIKYCKEKYNGECSQVLQRIEAPKLVKEFLDDANYDKAYYERIIELVVKHHDYDIMKNNMLQLLMEADLIINFYESKPDEHRLAKLKKVFKTEAGKKLLDLML